MIDKRNDTSAEQETVIARREIRDVANRQFKKKGTL
jgi:hypothetical protein